MFEILTQRRRGAEGAERFGRVDADVRPDI